MCVWHVTKQSQASASSRFTPRNDKAHLKPSHSGFSNLYISTIETGNSFRDFLVPKTQEGWQ